MEMVTLIGLVFVEALLLVFIISLSRSRRTEGRNGDSLIIFLLAFSVWAACNYLSNYTVFAHEALLYINRFLFLSSVFVAGGAYFFIGSVTKRLKLRSWQTVLHATAGVVASLISLTPFVVAGVYIDGSVVAIEFGQLFWLYFLSIALLIFTGLFWLARARRSRDRKIKAYARALFYSLGGAIIVIAMTNLVIPALFGNFALSTLGPMVSVFIIGGVSYAILQHGLFDIKGAAVRSTAYILVLSTLGLIYYLLAYAISEFVFQGRFGEETSVGPINVLLALFLAFLFQPVKHFFDRLTNKFFYKDDYNVGQFYDELNSLVRSTINLRLLLHRSAELIQTTLKSEHVSFFIHSGERGFIFVGTDGSKKLPREDIQLLNALDSVLYTEDKDIDPSLRRMLVSHRVAVVVPLYQNDASVGVMCLGEHKTLQYTRRDLRLLQTAAGELAIGVQNTLSVQEISDLNKNLQQRIDAATKELRRSNAQLQKLDQAKDEFISMASHQLRTPLTSIKGYISMLMDGDVGKVSTEQKHLLQEAFVSSERMVRLIGDFLNVSRLQTGKFIIEKRPVDLARLVRREIDGLESNAAARNITFVYKQPKNIPDIDVDENKIQQVVMNFADNAIYYSKEGSKIAVKLRKTAKAIEFTVVDTGIGVPADEQAQLFNKFFRATNARTQRPDGTGVGLFLAKRVIEDHHGEVIFSSKEGKGSTFGFRLPLQKK